MNIAVGRCALCLLEKPLQSSHLLPKALYRFVTNVGTSRDPNPVIVTPKSAWQSSKQVEAHLLCCECEQRFHSEGENWTLRHCYRGQRRFRLQEILAGTAPIADLGDALVFGAARIPAIDIRQLVHFAASVFWRASVRNWNAQEHRIRDIDLGPYAEEFRRFLLGRGEFPEHAAVLVDVFGFRSITLGTMIFPYGGNQGVYHCFKFSIPGVGFNLFVGQLMPSGVRRCCTLRSPEGILWSSKKDNAIVDNFVEMMRTAKVAQRLAGGL